MGPEDNVAEYYQQQVEMLEGFNEMDVLAERGSVAIVSKRDWEKLVRSETIANRIQMLQTPNPYRYPIGKKR
ncbi:Hypothetical predicted protein [Olea europaea subsp. europaea]|nr:Hypothetical predicted protein [Olea europaea subsp. europaea]